MVWDSGFTLKGHTSALPRSPPSQVLVAESFGGRDEPVDTLLTSLVDVGAEVGVIWGEGGGYGR